MSKGHRGGGLKKSAEVKTGNKTELGEAPGLGKSGEGLMYIKIAHKMVMFIGEEEGGDAEVAKEGGGVSIHTYNKGIYPHTGQSGCT